MKLRILGTAGLVAVVGLLIALAMAFQRPASPTLAAQLDQAGATGISVLGQGVVLAQPTQARAIFGVEIVDQSLAAAQGEAARRMQTVIDKLLELGVDRNDIKTVRFSVHPEYDHGSGGAVLTGYRVSNAVSAKLPDINGVGNVIDAVVAAGALRVEGVIFEIADQSQLKDQAREQAMANARAKAEQLARLGGVSLGRPILIEESDPGGVRPVTASPARAVADSATPIMPGELEIRTQVRVVYAIQ